MIYVIHTPHNGGDPTERHQWWTMYNDKASKWPPTILLGDFNAKLDPIQSDGIGDIPPPTTQPPEDSNDTYLRQAARSHGFTLLNTTMEHSPTHTLTTKTKGITTKQRVDYIAVNNHLVSSAHSLYIDHGHDSAARNADHSPVYVTLTMQRQLRTTPSTKPLFDPNKTQQSDRAQQYADILNAAPLPSWDIPPDQHHQQVSQLLHQAAKQCFPLDDFSPSQTNS